MISSHHTGDEETLKPQVDKKAVAEYLKYWGIDQSVAHGGVFPPSITSKSTSTSTPTPTAARKVYLLQRKKGKIGAGLGKTTGWIHRTVMKKRGVEEISGCKYVEINNEGLVIERGEGDKKTRQTLEVDTVVLCAGQVIPLVVAIRIHPCPPCRYTAPAE